MGRISQSILKLFCSLSSLLRRTEKEGNIIMRYLASTGLLMIYCFFSLFYTRLDIFYVLAFLCVFIICCMDYFCSTEFPIRAISYFYLGAAFFMPSFLIFLPAAAFVFLHHKNYVPLAPPWSACTAGTSRPAPLRPMPFLQVHLDWFCRTSC